MEFVSATKPMWERACSRRRPQDHINPEARSSRQLAPIKKPLTPQDHQRRTLVREVELFLTVKALILHMADHLRVVGPRLSDHTLRARIIQKQVMHQRR